MMWFDLSMFLSFFSFFRLLMDRDFRVFVLELGFRFDSSFCDFGLRTSISLSYFDLYFFFDLPFFLHLPDIV